MVQKNRTNALPLRNFHMMAADLDVDSVSVVKRRILPAGYEDRLDDGKFGVMLLLLLLLVRLLLLR